MREANGADGKPTKRLNIIADRLVKLAMSGDMAAIKEVFDRIDGKLTSATEPADDGQVILHFNTGIIRPGGGAYPTIEADRHMIDSAEPIKG